ncbi:MAG: flippase [Candidatus Andersenbacteria bacterium]
MSVLRSSIGVFATRIWGAFVGIVVSIIIARTLGPQGKGIYSLLLLVPTLLLTFGNLGLNVSNVYFYGKRGAKASDLAANSFWAALVLGLLAVGAFALLSPLLAPRFYADVPAGFMLASVATVPAQLLNQYVANLLLATRRTWLFNLANALQLTVLLANAVVSLLILHQGLVATVYIADISVVVGTILMVLFYVRYEGLALRFKLALFKETLLFGLKGYFANVIQFLNYRVDMLMLSAFMGATAVGAYSIGVNFAETLWYVPTSIGTVLFPHVANSTLEVANVTTARASRQTFLLMTLASGAVAAAAPWLVPKLFGTQFASSVVALWWLLPGVLIFSIAKIIGNDFAGRGYVVVNGMVSAAALVLNVTLNLFLIPRYGIVGASISSTISYTVATVLLVSLFAREAKVRWWHLVWPNRQDVKELYGLARRPFARTEKPRG